MSPLYMFDATAGKLRAPGYPDRTPPGIAMLTAAQLVDASLFGVPAGTTLEPLAFGPIASASGQVYTNRLITHTTTSAPVTGSGNTFINCAWPDLELLDKGVGNVYDHCQGGKFLFGGGSTNCVVKMYKSVPMSGKDALGSGGTVVNATIDGCYILHDHTILGASEHYDGGQFRGTVTGLVLRNFSIRTTGISDRYNAMIFLHEDTGQVSDVLIENGIIGTGNKHLFGSADDVKVRGLALNRAPKNTIPIAAGSSINLTEWTNVRYDDGTVIPQPTQPN